MREPPVDLSEETLRAGLRAHYGLTATDITFLPLGHDSSAWVYQLRTTGNSVYFLKVRSSVTNPSSLQVPRYLHDHGVAHVVAPLPTITQCLWVAVGGYAIILYPFVAGITGMDHGMTPLQWIAYGALLRQIHTTAVTSDLAQHMRRETFVPVGAAMVRDLEVHMGGRTLADPPAWALATFWQQRHDDICTLVARAEALGRLLAERAPAFVLCHADIHTANLLLDAEGQIWIVDWDETVLAPKERDLMFVAGGGISRALIGLREEEMFVSGYGSATIDPLALSYYRYAWAVSDIGAYGAQILLRPDLGAVSKRAALDAFISLFLTGNIVELAFALDDPMPL